MLRTNEFPELQMTHLNANFHILLNSQPVLCLHLDIYHNHKNKFFKTCTTEYWESVKVIGNAQIPFECEVCLQN